MTKRNNNLICCTIYSYSEGFKTMIEWNDGLSVGVDILDDDHKNLLKIINNLSQALDKNQQLDVILSIFDELEEYTLVHFKREESFLKKCNYKNYDDHKQQHQTFADKIPELKEKLLDIHDTISAQDISIYLTDWLLEHIISEDMPVISLFEECGLTSKKQTKTSMLHTLIDKTTNTFSFTKRILLSALIPLIGMLILGLIILWNNYNIYDDMKKTSDVTKIISSMNTLVHNLQIERGLSAGYITSVENKFKYTLEKQNKIVDAAIKSFNLKIKTVDITKLVIQKNIETYTTDAISIESVREKVYNKNITQKEALATYTKMIHNMLDINTKMAFLNQDRQLTSYIATLSSMLHFKESIGQERALGTMIIEKKSTTINEYVRFVELLGSQKTHLDSFNEASNKTQKNKLTDILNSTFAKQILAYENDLKTNNYISLDSKLWFETTTKFIDILKVFENELIDDINFIINTNLNNNRNKLILWFIYTVIILFITFFIIYLFEKSTKKQLFQLINAMQHIADNGRSLRLPSSQLKDYISQIYDAYETTRQALLKGDVYAQLYLSQKEIELKNQQIQNDKLEELAFIDPLTGAINRRKFEELSNLELERSTRYKISLSFLMLDIDKFKSINDTYGHAIGDIVLKHFTSICLEMARKLDIVARIGGEEFIVMLPETNTEGAYIFAQRFREEIFNSSIDIDNQTIKYTVSIGISTLDTDTDTDISTILQRADSALYKAKDTGRNKCVIYKD